IMGAPRHADRGKVIESIHPAHASSGRSARTSGTRLRKAGHIRAERGERGRRGLKQGDGDLQRHLEWARDVDRRNGDAGVVKSEWERGLRDRAVGTRSSGRPAPGAGRARLRHGVRADGEGTVACGGAGTVLEQQKAELRLYPRGGRRPVLAAPGLYHPEQQPPERGQHEDAEQGRRHHRFDDREPPLAARTSTGVNGMAHWYVTLPVFDWIVITLLAPVDALVNVIVPATAGTPRLSNVQTFDAHVVV